VWTSSHRHEDEERHVLIMEVAGRKRNPDARHSHQTRLSQVASLGSRRTPLLAR
jgi:hypothetical protein